MDERSFIEVTNQWASEKIPFIFIVDYERENFIILKLEDAAKQGVYYSIHGNSNLFCADKELKKDFVFDIMPMSFVKYNEAFQLVQKNIYHGNSFLLNLTFPTPIKTSLDLRQIFQYSRAPYKLFVEDQFVVFSPESFIKIENDKIYSYPMKGTINADIPGAGDVILNDPKETWEHNTIVDLIRNDLSMVSKDVTVNRFRYLDAVKTSRKNLLQVSSEIMGTLDPNWKEKLGEILLKLLPAGSICGAPKKKTCEIISAAEGQKRGFFTGIFGIYDGSGLDSAVLIRYIEKSDEGLQFRSGGGITGHSHSASEYNELIDKVYVPISRKY